MKITYQNNSDTSCIMYFLALMVMLVSAPAYSQENAADFDPLDFSGDWERETGIIAFANVPGASRSPANVPMPDQGSTQEPPFTEEGRRIYLENMPGYGPNRREFERNDPIGRCEPAGIPRNLIVEIIEPHDTFEIVQMDDRIFQFFEYRHDWREIWMDGRELPTLEETWPKWSGSSVGRFEGNTLIVESIGFDGWGNYGMLIVTVYRFRWRARATTWLLVGWYRHRFNYPVNADPATPHQHVVASLFTTCWHNAAGPVTSALNGAL